LHAERVERGGGSASTSSINASPWAEWPRFGRRTRRGARASSSRSRWTFLLESFSGDPELERLFVKEARTTVRLRRANLATVFDVDKIDADGERGLVGRCYIAMERIERQDLRGILEAARRAGYVFPCRPLGQLQLGIMRSPVSAPGSADPRSTGTPRRRR
jgi:hypothetical protein